MNSTGVTRAQPVYFVHPFVDYLLAGGGSILVLAAAVALFPAERTSTVILIAVQLAWVINWPHFAATNYRLYHSRETIRQYPLTALLVPWVMVAMVAAAVAWPAAVAPACIKLFYVWSPYHFSGQTIGVTLLYLRRAGVDVTRGERQVLSLAVYSTMIALIVGVEVNPLMLDYYGIRYPSFGLPAWLDLVARIYTGGMFVALLACFIRWQKRTGGGVPGIVLVPAIAQYAWFVLGRAWPTFTEFVPLFHSVQYLLIAWSMQLKERKDRARLPGSARFVWRESLRWYLLNLAGGALLFWVLPRAVGWSTGVALPFVTGMVLIGVQIHHFLVDGVIWKLKRTTVSSPLMGDLDELLHDRPGRPPNRAPSRLPAPVVS
jgi:hypothetical protein